MVDQEDGVLDSVRGSQWGPLFRSDNFVNDKHGGSGTYAKGRYAYGFDLKESTLDAFRREAERCDEMEAYQFVYSLGGGTGSGSGTLLMSLIDDEYMTKRGPIYAVFPSENASGNVTEPYNAVLAIHQLIEDS